VSIEPASGRRGATILTTFFPPLPPFSFSSKRQCHRYTQEDAESSGHWDKDIVKVMESLLDPEVADQGSNKKEKVEYIFIKVGRGRVT
jgi:hypothetical protein